MDQQSEKAMFDGFTAEAVARQRARDDGLVVNTFAGGGWMGITRDKAEERLHQLNLEVSTLKMEKRDLEADLKRAQAAPRSILGKLLFG